MLALDLGYCKALVLGYRMNTRYATKSRISRGKNQKLKKILLKKII